MGGGSDSGGASSAQGLQQQQQNAALARAFQTGFQQFGQGIAGGQTPIPGAFGKGMTPYQPQAQTYTDPFAAGYGQPPDISGGGNQNLMDIFKRLGLGGFQ